MKIFIIIQNQTSNFKIHTSSRFRFGKCKNDNNNFSLTFNCNSVKQDLIDVNISEFNCVMILLLSTFLDWKKNWIFQVKNNFHRTYPTKYHRMIIYYVTKQLYHLDSIMKALNDYPMMMMMMVLSLMMLVWMLKIQHDLSMMMMKKPSFDKDSIWTKQRWIIFKQRRIWWISTKYHYFNNNNSSSNSSKTPATQTKTNRLMKFKIKSLMKTGKKKRKKMWSKKNGWCCCFLLLINNGGNCW